MDYSFGCSFPGRIVAVTVIHSKDSNNSNTCHYSTNSNNSNKSNDGNKTLGLAFFDLRVAKKSYARYSHGFRFWVWVALAFCFRVGAIQNMPCVTCHTLFWKVRVSQFG